MAEKFQEIVVTDVKIPFLSMVVLLVKWSLAAIPAVLILVAVWVVLSMVLGTIFDGMFGWHSKA